MERIKRSRAARLALMPYRYWTARRYVTRPLRDVRRWVFTSREFTNYTYDLTVYSRRCLAAFVASITGASTEEAERYINELQDDEELRSHIRTEIASSPWSRVADPEPLYARRAGWYAVARLTKPRVVVETGVDKGLGACVLTAALIRNAADGQPGEYFGTDINPNAGFLLSGKYAQVGTIMYGDSLESLSRLSETIDLFINDSDHSIAYERLEYQCIAHRLGPSSIVLGDNSGWSPELLNFAQETGRRFLLFNEQPTTHWYRGGSIGACFV